LIVKIDSFDTKVQKRLKKIEKNWDRYTAFYFVKGAPATNNPIENLLLHKPENPQEETVQK